MMGMTSETTTHDALIEALAEARASADARDALIRCFMPLIIKTVSEVTGRYVVVGDSDELSIGLMAFDEAISRYEVDRGAFVPFAKLVITSRMKSHLSQMKPLGTDGSLEEAEHVAAVAIDEGMDTLKEEIEIWKSELCRFGITFRQLVVEKPKHKGTRETAFRIAEDVSATAPIVERMYKILRLPITMVHEHLKVSVRVIENSKTFITAVVIIFIKELGALKRWIRFN